MDAITLPANSVPAEFKKSCEQILKRAQELKAHDPAMAYWCSFSAVQKALDVKQRSAEGTKWIMSLLDALEEMKATLAGNEAVTSEAAGSAYVENFALKVFLAADNLDRSGQCDKRTISKFVVASQFLEVLRCFQAGMSDEMEQKLQYARWKAADIAKALREGREPVPGPPVPESPPAGDLEDANPFPSLGGVSSELPSSPPPAARTFTSPPSGSPAQGSSPKLGGSPRLGSPPADTPKESSRHSSFSSLQKPVVSPSPRPSPLQKGHLDLPQTPLDVPGRNDSGTWSTIATPGVPDDDEKVGEASDPATPFIPSPPRSASPPNAPITIIPAPGSPLARVTSVDKSVRFQGPDGAPLSPPETMASVPFFPEQPAPAPSAVTPGGSTELNNFSLPSAPPPVVSPPRPAPSAPPVARAPPPSAPQQRPNSVPAPMPAPAPVAAIPVVTGPARKLNFKETEICKKHAKWAISALEFDDVETARSELLKALAMLN